MRNSSESGISCIFLYSQPTVRRQGIEKCGECCSTPSRPIIASAFSSPSLIGFLPLIVNRQNACALVDSTASDCFIREKYLTSEIKWETVQYIIHTASKTRKMVVKIACVLPINIAGQTENMRFLVCDELDTDVTLGRTWLKAQKVMHDHDLDC